MGSTDVNYALRFPNGMRDQLKAVAKDNRRSMHSEILRRLEASHPKAGRTTVLPEDSRIADKTLLRLPSRLYARLKLDAQAHGRSLNAECLVRLAASLEPASGPERPVTPDTNRNVSLEEMRLIRKKVAKALESLDALIERADG